MIVNPIGYANSVISQKQVNFNSSIPFRGDAQSMDEWKQRKANIDNMSSQFDKNSPLSKVFSVVSKLLALGIGFFASRHILTSSLSSYAESANEKITSFLEKKGKGKLKSFYEKVKNFHPLDKICSLLSGGTTFAMGMSSFGLTDNKKLSENANNISDNVIDKANDINYNSNNESYDEDDSYEESESYSDDVVDDE